VIPPKVPALGLDLNFSLKLGREQRFGVLKSGSLFSAPGGSFLGESYERKLNFLGNVLEVLGDSGQAEATDQVINCFDSEVTKYRDINARLLQEIQENSGHIADMVRNTDIRKKMISQLEFDVNIIERESKKLQCDLTTIQSIGDHLENSCEHSGHSQDIMEPGQPVKLGQTSGLQTELNKKLEYGSDSSSDTGVCSLSSSEGDYSLSTLV